MLIATQAGSNSHLKRNWGNPQGMRKELKDIIEAELKVSTSSGAVGDVESMDVDDD
jgi:hypothetical protein